MTEHHRLAELGVEVVRDQRWVHDGKLTSQGISAGIDSALGSRRGPAPLRRSRSSGPSP